MSQAGRWSLRVEAESEGVTMQGHPEVKHKPLIGGSVPTALRDFQKFGLGDQIPSLNTEGKQEC